MWFRPMFLAWIPPVVSIIGFIVVISVFESKPYADEYSCPSVLTASQFEPMARIAAILFGHAVIAFCLACSLHSDGLRLLGNSTSFRFLPYVAGCCMFVALWCTMADQFYVNVIFSSLALFACVSYMLSAYLVTRSDTSQDLHGSIARIVLATINGVLVLLWFVLMIAVGKGKKGTYAILTAICSFLLLISLNAFAIYLHWPLSRLEVQLVLDG